MSKEIESELTSIRDNVIRRNSNALGVSDFKRLSTARVRDKIKSLGLKTLAYGKGQPRAKSVYSENIQRDALLSSLMSQDEGGGRGKVLVNSDPMDGKSPMFCGVEAKDQMRKRGSEKLKRSEFQIAGETPLELGEEEVQEPKLNSRKKRRQGMKAKRVTFNLPEDMGQDRDDFGLESESNPEDDTSEEISEQSVSVSDESDEVWFNDQSRKGTLIEYFNNEEHVLELVVTIYALIKFFNRSTYSEILEMMVEGVQGRLELEVEKIILELDSQVDHNKQDLNMGESNYLLVIQNDLEDTQMRLAETQRLLTEKQVRFTDLEIKANGVVRAYTDLEKEHEAYVRYNGMMEEELGAIGVKNEEYR